MYVRIYVYVHCCSACLNGFIASLIQMLTMECFLYYKHVKYFRISFLLHEHMKWAHGKPIPHAEI